AAMRTSCSAGRQRTTSSRPTNIKPREWKKPPHGSPERRLFHEVFCMYARDVPQGQIFYHGTKADLAMGDLIRPGFGSNFVERELKHIYFTATLGAATWGAELARGEGRGRIYIVEPTGPFEDDPNLTDKKNPGNQTASY